MSIFFNSILYDYHYIVVFLSFNHYIDIKQFIFIPIIVSKYYNYDISSQKQNLIIYKEFLISNFV